MLRISRPLIAMALAGAALWSFPAAAQSSHGKDLIKGAKTAAVATFGNSDAIGEQELRAYLYFLASDALEGRNFPSRGYDTAALYVASHLAEWGLRPGGSTSGVTGPLQPYFMPIEMESRQLLPEESTAALTSGGGAPQVTNFAYGKQWAFGNPGFPNSPEALDVSGNLVFAGNGWVIHKINADPYKGLDVRGKIVVIAGMPQLGADSLGEPCIDFFTPQQYAARNGALAVVTVSNAGNAAYMATAGNARPAPNGPPFVVKKFQQAATCPSAPIVTAGPDLTNALFAYEPHNGAEIFYIADKNAAMFGAPEGDARPAAPSAESFALDARKTLHLHVAVRSEAGHGENVIGILEGADPVLKNEYVILSAHLDHLGLSAPSPGGHAVFSGADDNASGAAGLLAMAHAYATGVRPKRSILFLWNGGEEKGLSGSGYFAQFPPIDLSTVVAALNLDMIGRTRNPNSVDTDKTHLLVERGEVLVIGPQISSASLGATIDAVNADYQKLKLNHFYDATHSDETHDNLGPQPRGQSLYSRSDQYNFARMGIPFAYFTTGLHADYHRATDTADKIDFAELQMVARTAAAVAWNLGNQSGRPKLDATLPSEIKAAMESAQKQGWGKVTPVRAPLPGMPF